MFCTEKSIKSRQNAFRSKKKGQFYVERNVFYLKRLNFIQFHTIHTIHTIQTIAYNLDRRYITNLVIYLILPGVHFYPL